MNVSRLLLIINFIVLLTLTFFAKDSLLAEFHSWFLSDSMKGPIRLKPAGSIEVVFSPNQGATSAIIKALSEARSSILVSAYSFTSKDIAKALLAAKNRQVMVKIILDKSQVSHSYSSSTFFINQGFDIKIDIKHAIYHNKVMIIDDNTVITGSFNFTKAAESKNAENLLIIRNNTELAKLYSKNWYSHWSQAVYPDEFSYKKRK